MDTTEKYVLRVQSHIALSAIPNTTPMTNEGDWFWVTKDDEGWVPASSIRSISPKEIPGDILTFDTKEQAEEFAKKWKGHPWWCKPNGNYQVLKVVPVFKHVQVGWEGKED